MRLCTILALALIFTTPAFAEEEQIVERVECSRGADKRRLEVHTKDAGCRTQYFKAGSNSQIASSRKGVTLCEDRLQRVQKTLESANFECKKN